MKYQVIARRYRPRRFDEVVGQDSVAATLRNAILQDRLAHAFLFAGPRGVGKTSMARIFAKALNCPSASERSRPREEWGLACETCEVCRAVHAGEDIDVLEMDGASYRGIEEIRDIVENVKFTPSRSPFKIFIIDEVHMLTREAFNALLKTLEEPPGHVKFIFATTEPHKIPDTVLSRCQRFDFRPIREEDIVKRLEQICLSEGVKAEPELLAKMGRYGKGGLRDAQTLLDQAITFSEGGVLKSEDLERITGRLPEAFLDVLLEAIGGRKPPEAFRALEECFARGADPATLLDQVIERLHNRLLSLVEGMEAGREGGKPAEAADLDLLLGRLQVLNETALKLRGSPYPRLAVELALLKLARMEDPRALEEALGYLKSVEDRLGRGAERAPEAAGRPPQREPAHGPLPPPPRAQAAAPPSPAPRMEAAPPPPPPPAEHRPEERAPAGESRPSQGKPEFSHLTSLWGQILIEAGQRFPKIKAFLGKARIKEAPQAGGFTVVLESDFNLRQLREPQRLRDLEALVKEVTGSVWRVGYELEPPADGGGPPGAAGGGRGGQEAGATGSAQRGRGGASLKDDPLVKKSLDLFKGKIV